MYYNAGVVNYEVVGSDPESNLTIESYNASVLTTIFSSTFKKGFSTYERVGATTMVARFFLVQTYQNKKNIPNDHKLYQTAINHTKWP
jgi:hypothetical protein